MTVQQQLKNVLVTEVEPEGRDTANFG